MGKTSLKYAFIALCLLFTCFGMLKAQDNLLLYTTKVTVTAQNVEVREILDLIEQSNGVTFSYKSGLINERRRVTFKVAELPLYNTLDSLFKNDSLEYYPLGKQIVIYKPSATSKPRKIIVRDTLEQIILRKDTVQVEVLRKDTVFISKTDTLWDTIYIKTPFPVYDTIFMDKPKVRFETFYTLNSVFNSRSSTSNTWKTPDMASGKTADELYKSGESNGIMQRIVAMAQINLSENFYLKTGLGLSIKSWNANYNFTTEFYDSTQIIGYDEDFGIKLEITVRDSFPFYFPGSDTLWFYEYDTLFIPTTINPIYRKDSTTHSYKGRNQLRFITIPLFLGGEFPINEESNLFYDVGLLIDFLVSSTGKSLSESRYAELLPLSELPFSPVSAYLSLGVGYERQFRSNYSWFVKLNYDRQFNSEFSKSYPIRQRKNLMGFSVGIKF